MATGDGIITRKDIITDEALAFGKEYRKNVEEAINANDELIKQFRILHKVSGDYRKSQDQSDFRKAKQEESIANQKMLNELKQMGALERELERIKQEKVKTEKELLRVAKENLKVAMQKAQMEGVAERELQKIKQDRARTEKELVRVQLENEKLSRLQAQTEQTNTKEVQRLKQELLRTEREAAKLKQDKIRLEKMESDQVKRKTVLTMEERVQQQLLNKADKEAVLEKMGLIGVYQKLNRQRTEAKKRLQDLIAAEGASNREIRKAQQEFDRLDAKVRKADNATRDFTKNVGNYKSAFSGLFNLMGAFGIIGGITGAVELGKSIYNTTKELETLYKSMKLGSKSAEDYASNLKFLDKITEDYGLELISTTQAYNKFYLAAKNKLSIEEIQLVFDKVSKSAGIMGMTVEQQEGTFKALSDMMSKGTVMAEELKGQLGDRIPVAVEVMAKAVGVGTEELLKMMQNGEIMAADVLPKFAIELEKAVGADQVKRVETLTAAENRLKNAWTDFIEEINGSDNVIGNFAIGFLSVLTDMLNGINRVASSWKSIWDEGRKSNESFGYKSAMNNYLDFDKFENQRKRAFKDRQKFLKEEQELIDQIKDGEQALAAAEKRRIIPNWLGGSVVTKDANRNLEELNKKLGDTRGRIKAIEDLYKNWKDPEIKVSQIKGESEKERKKREAAFRKAQREAEKAAKEAEKLETDRLKKEKESYEAGIDLLIYKKNAETEIFKAESVNEKNTQDERYKALISSQKAEEEALKLNYEKQLTLSRAFQKDRAAFTEEEKKYMLESKSILSDVSTLTNAELLILEKYYAEQEKLRKQNKKDIESNIDFEISQLQKKQDSKLLGYQSEMSGEIGALSIGNNLTDVENYEKAVYEIKRKYMLKEIEDNIALYKSILENENLTQEQKEKNTKILLGLQEDLREFNNQTHIDNLTKANEIEQRYIEMGENIKNALVDLTNAIFDNRIQRIDEDIERSDEQYERQIELYEGDAARQKAIREQQEREREKLEAKKRKEQHKQAVFNKAMAITDIGFNTAIAIMSSIAKFPGPVGIALGVLAGVLGTIQTAAVLATPIPKYKMGRKGGPEEIAIVGDGGVHEVVEHPDGSAYITPNRDTVVKLFEGDVVHSSIDKYRESQRVASLNGLQRSQNIMGAYLKEKEYRSDEGLIKEIRELQRILKNKNMTTTVNVPKMDLGYELWRLKQIGGL